MLVYHCVSQAGTGPEALNGYLAIFCICVSKVDVESRFFFFWSKVSLVGMKPYLISLTIRAPSAWLLGSLPGQQGVSEPPTAHNEVENDFGPEGLCLT